MIDEWIWGTVTRISPEAPVPVVAVADHSFTLGGAGNVANNLRALRADVVFAGTVGDDAFGDAGARAAARTSRSTIGRLHARRPADDAQDARRRAQPASRARRLGVDRAACPTRSRTDRRVRARRAADCDAVILSDYAKGLLCRDIVEAASICPARAGRSEAAERRACCAASRASRRMRARHRTMTGISDRRRRDPRTRRRALARDARLPVRGDHARRTRHGALRTRRRAAADSVGRAHGLRRQRRGRYGHRGARAGAGGRRADRAGDAAGELCRRSGRREARHRDRFARRDRRAGRAGDGIG